MDAASPFLIDISAKKKRKKTKIQSSFQKIEAFRNKALPKLSLK